MYDFPFFVVSILEHRKSVQLVCKDLLTLLASGMLQCYIASLERSTLLVYLHFCFEKIL
jgi:hypothetical protein